MRPHQALFHQRFHHLNDPHVRALAWLLDAPDLLDPCEPEWKGKIATLGPMAASTADWLAELDRAPGLLHAQLQVRPFSRLGRYAEQLMAYFLQAQGRLVAHGLQVRNENKRTIGEFDFLLRHTDGLLHWEFASKFYLLEAGTAGRHRTDCFVGPNLADTLGKKIRKIIDQQLSLSAHPAAAAYLPGPVAASQALIKGWLFYHVHEMNALEPGKVATEHCSGFWCSLSELDQHAWEYCTVLPRLSWLAPARVPQGQAESGSQLKSRLAERFEHDSTPVMVAVLQIDGGGNAVEADRGFIVPDDWKARAGVACDAG